MADLPNYNITYSGEEVDELVDKFTNVYLVRFFNTSGDFLASFMGGYGSRLLASDININNISDRNFNDGSELIRFPYTITKNVDFVEVTGSRIEIAITGGSSSSPGNFLQVSFDGGSEWVDVSPTEKTVYYNNKIRVQFRLRYSVRVISLGYLKDSSGDSIITLDPFTENWATSPEYTLVPGDILKFTWNPGKRSSSGHPVLPW